MNGNEADDEDSPDEPPEPGEAGTSTNENERAAHADGAERMDDGTATGAEPADEEMPDAEAAASPTQRRVEAIPPGITDPRRMYLLGDLAFRLLDEQRGHPAQAALAPFREQMAALATQAIEASREHPIASPGGIAACEQLRRLINGAPPRLLHSEANVERLRRLREP